MDMPDIDEFDLPGFLLGELYNHFNDDMKSEWCLEEAKLLSEDLHKDGIEADANEIFEIISEFIAQDAEEAE